MEWYYCINELEMELAPKEAPVARVVTSLKQINTEHYKQKSPHKEGFSVYGSLTMTYFHMGNPHYHRRKVVSLSCSRWEGVGPTCYCRQT